MFLFIYLLQQHTVFKILVKHILCLYYISISLSFVNQVIVSVTGFCFNVGLVQYVFYTSNPYGRYHIKYMINSVQLSFNVLFPVFGCFDISFVDCW